MKFWAQRNEIIHMTVNAWGEAGIVDGSYSKEASFQIKMKVFPLPSQNINDLLSLLKEVFRMEHGNNLCISRNKCRQKRCTALCTGTERPVC